MKGEARGGFRAFFPVLRLYRAEMRTAAGRTARLRLLCFGGLLLVSALLWLGFIWPSLFTFVALPAVPAVPLFLVGMVRPEIVTARPWLRRYLLACALAAVVCWVVEVVWLWWVTD